MKTGVIIPTRGSFEYAERACRTARAAGAEVVLVDDASDGCPSFREAAGWGVAALQRYDRPGGLTRSWNAGLAIVRRLGCEAAACANSDVLFSSRSLAELTGALRAWDFVGPVSNAPGHVRVQRVDRWLRGYRATDSPAAIEKTQDRLLAASPAPLARRRLNGFCFVGTLAGFARFGLRAAAPLDPSLPMAGNEDAFFSTASARGARIGVVPTAFVFHYRSVTRGLRGDPNLEHGAYRSGATG